MRHRGSAVLVIAAALALTACGGTRAPAAFSTATTIPGMSAETQGLAEAKDGGIESAVQSWVINQATVPYKDIRVERIREDDQFATVQVYVQVRRSEAEDWDEIVATVALKKLGNVWEIDRASQFVSPAAQATATALAAMATEVARQEQLAAANRWVYAAPAASAMAETFMQALRDAEYAKAYNMLEHKSFGYTSIATLEEFTTFFEAGRRPTSWTFAPAHEYRGYINFSATVTLSDGSQDDWLLYMNQREGSSQPEEGWQVAILE